MKYLKKIILFALAISILCITFYSVYIPVCASEHGGGGGNDHGKLTEEEKSVKKLEILNNIERYLLFLCSEIGVAFSGSSYSDFYKNYVDYVKSKSDRWFEDNVSVSDDGNAVFSKELMSSIKAYIDQYAKEHEPYYMVNTYTLDNLTGNLYAAGKLMYDTAKNLLNDSPSGVIAFGATYNHPENMYFADVGNEFRNISPVRYYENNDHILHFYNNESWNRCSFKVYYYTASISSEAVKTAAEFIENATETYNYGFNYNFPIGYAFKVLPIGESVFNFPYNCDSPGQSLILITKESRRIRVFNTYGDFQNYTLGKRSVYYTSKYYNYVPEDLTVSLDDLQKEIDDLSKVIDKLLEQITDDTDESEIEELLRQILEELRNQQSGGGGGGANSSNVTVNVDMKETNSWLSKIYSKVSQIYDKISSSAGQSMSEVVESIEDMKQMLQKYLKEIAGDLDDIKGQLEEMTEEEFSDKTDSFLDETTESFSEIGELAKKKFPLSIPYDLYNLLAVISPKQPDTGKAVIYSLDKAEDQAVYSGESLSLYESNGKIMTVREGGSGGSLGMSAAGAPVFNLPIVVTSVGWDYTVTVDMTQFQTIADLSRTMFTLIFILGMIKLSILVIGLWGDIVD